MFGSLWKMSLWQWAQALLRGWGGECSCSLLDSWSPYLLQVAGNNAKAQLPSQQDPLEFQGRNFLKTFYLVSQLDDLLRYHVGQSKLNSLSTLIQSPWKIIERIKGSGKILHQAKTKLHFGGDFPWCCKLPARLCLSEHSPFILCQVKLWSSQALILTLFRLMETWKNFF